MSRVAVFIDAGYFWVQTTHIITGARGPRATVIIDYTALHQTVLDEVARQFPGKDLLRVFWYDGPGPSGTKEPDHLEIDRLDDFKLRLGTRNMIGQQKAVDGMIISDLLTCAQTKAIENALLVTGDADLTPGVVSAQSLGLRVHLLIIGPQNSTSPYLSAEADRKVTWDALIVNTFAKRSVVDMSPVNATEPQPGSGYAQPAAKRTLPLLMSADIESVAVAARSKILAGPDAGRLRAATQDTQALPATIDKALLQEGTIYAGRMLQESEKRQLRIAFKALL